MQAVGSLCRRLESMAKPGQPSGVFRFSVNYFGSAAVDTGAKEHIQKLVNNDKVVVFMKGTPTSPQCGFSRAVMEVLRMHGVSKFSTHNVLEDEKLRQGIKDYSNWPTIPQVFFGGEFLGGCDIMIEMHQKGELVDELEKIGIRSKIVDKTSPSEKTPKS